MRTVPVLLLLATVWLGASAAGCAHARPATTNATTAVSGVPRWVPISPPTKRRTVAIVLYPGVELLDFAGPAEVLGANRAFRVYTVAASHDPLVSQRFLTIVPTYSADDAPPADLMIVPGGTIDGLTSNEKMMRYIRERVAHDELSMSVCNGALAFAAIGALDGLEATTHWGSLGALASKAPKATVVADARYTDNGRVLTTAGVSAGIDGALHVVQRLAGEESAWRTARYMMYAWEPEDGAIIGRAPLPPAEREAMRAWVMRDWKTAARLYAERARADPDDGHAWARWAEAQASLGRSVDALAAFDRAAALGTVDAFTANAHAQALADVGRIEDAVRLLEKLARDDEVERPFAFYAIACHRARADRRDDALSALRRAVEAGFPFRSVLASDSDLASLHGDPRFDALLDMVSQ